MGIPSFYRWLVRKYPKVVVKAREEANGYEVDNLYLDMNGIIYRCILRHDEYEPPASYEEVFDNIFAYIDRIIHLVRPTKLLYMAIDGVAPQAKNNKQRSGQILSAKAAELIDEDQKKLRQEFEIEGKKLLPKGSALDPIVIAPGTKFMNKILNALHQYICSRLNTDIRWNGIKVILSDANVPGEGEHKIMSFIRVQRSLPGYDPNLRHCVHGTDADLIMLALASHEVHISILREVAETEQDILSIKKQHDFLTSSKTVRKSDAGCSPAVSRDFAKISFEFLQVWILREYLQLDMEIPDAPHEVDFERVVDDFVFMCFFIGNDFLPHLPSLEMHERALDLLMTVYKEKFKDMGGYLVDVCQIKDKNAGYIRLSAVERFILAVGSYEENIFQKRSQLKQHRVKKFLREKMEALAAADEENMVLAESSEHMMEFSGKKKEQPCDPSDLWEHGSWRVDKVKLGVPGWKQRYYKEKFSIRDQDEIEGTIVRIVKSYVEGLYWVLHYYYAGVLSWTWFYDYYYSPFASDLKGLTTHQIEFEMGKPFKPFDYLLAVLQLSCAHALPKIYQPLMTSDKSNICDFYPPDFDIDMDGKRFLWQCVVKLPFIDGERLTTETQNLEKHLQPDELQRNREGHDRIYVVSSSDFGRHISLSYGLYTKLPKEDRKSTKYPIDSHASGGLHGYIRFIGSELNENNSCSSEGRQKMEDAFVIFALFELPDSQDNVLFLGKNVELPEKTITEVDIEKTTLWHVCQWRQQRDNNREKVSANGSYSIQNFKTDSREVRNKEIYVPPYRRDSEAGSGCIQSRKAKAWDVGNNSLTTGWLEDWQQKPTFWASGGRGAQPHISRADRTENWRRPAMPPDGWSSGNYDTSSSKSSGGGRPPSL